ncbi:hypothetical protein I7X12_10105 [Halosimplex litoreum]|uniref:Uncharacterized protein n=1 Tax=Halosimplex litoreum TaxID=1198301 RepID=A0A7U3WBD4_9EURY|nr:hypothetical protein [Halosimplex litoreum]QPV64929.1 hypothetical protein I7X12_10105 [Halosimplex litoreum]
MIGSVRRFLATMAEEDARTRVFLLWNAGNTVGAVGLLVGAFALLVVTNAPGFQRDVLLAYITLAVLWLVSIFTIGPLYDRVVPET